MCFAETEAINKDQGTDVPSSTTNENRGRIVTRRISQESASSIISTTNSTSDAGSPKKRRNKSQKAHTESVAPQGW